MDFLFECSIHGMLPISNFNQFDNFNEPRHRCKDCVAESVRKWRRRHPLKLMWLRFMERLKTREREIDWSWDQEGKQILIELLKKQNLYPKTIQEEENIRNQYRLKYWDDTDKIVLIQKQESWKKREKA
jgi:hypothetical protein